jgi:hypothetical protein
MAVGIWTRRREDLAVDGETACEDLLHARPRRRRWKQLVPTSWLSVGAMRDDRGRRLSAATGREGPGAGVLYAALLLLHYATPFVKNGISH